MEPRREWLRTVAAAAAGLVLGVSALVAGALLLYSAEGFLSSTGFLIALAVVSVAAGIWVGAPEGPVPGHRRMLGRWTLAVGALVVASFVAGLWLRSPSLQGSAFGAPLVLVLLLAEPAYALGALLAALEARRRGWLAEQWHAVRLGSRSPGRAGGVGVPALLGLAVGALVATAWLIPSLPPGPIFIGGGLLLAVVGSLEMTLAGEAKEGSMQDRVVVVTGVGDRGQVGYAVAEALVERGARVVITGRSAQVETLAAELGGAVAVVADLSEPDGAERVVEAARSRWGRIDGLVNVAGGLRVIKPLADTSLEEWRRELQANTETVFLMTRAALPLLRQSGGAVVNFASPAGERAVRNLGAYGAAKAGVVAVTRSLAVEEKTHGVRVNAVAPGMVDTAQNRADSGDAGTDGWVSREQVAEVVLFLLDRASSGVSGQVIHVATPER